MCPTYCTCTEMWCKERYSLSIKRCDAAGVAASGPPRFEAERRKVLRLAYAPLAPFIYEDEENNGLYGIDVDIWRLVARKMRMQAEFVHCGNNGKIPPMVRERFPTLASRYL